MSERGMEMEMGMSEKESREERKKKIEAQLAELGLVFVDVANGNGPHFDELQLMIAEADALDAELTRLEEEAA